MTRDYEEREYDFLVITDHNVVADVSQSRAVTLLVIPGAEIAVCYDGTFAMEVCTLGIDEVRRCLVHPQQVIDDVLGARGDTGDLPSTHEWSLFGQNDGVGRD